MSCVFCGILLGIVLTIMFNLIFRLKLCIFNFFDNAEAIPICQGFTGVYGVVGRQTGMRIGDFVTGQHAHTHLARVLPAKKDVEGGKSCGICCHAFSGYLKLS